MILEQQGQPAHQDRKVRSALRVRPVPPGRKDRQVRQVHRGHKDRQVRPALRVLLVLPEPAEAAWCRREV